MDKKTTSIFFSIDKNVSNSEESIKAAVSLSKKCTCELTYVLTSESLDILGANHEEGARNFKLRYFTDVKQVKTDQGLWKGLAEESQKYDCNLVVLGAPPIKSSLFGGGMAGAVSRFDAAIVFIGDKSTWSEPKSILMPLDSQSETRQKFFRVSEIARMYRSTVNVLGVAQSNDSEEKTYVHTYSFQGKNYMEERKIRAELKEVTSKNCAETVLEESDAMSSNWISAVSNTEGAFKTSSFQKVAESASVPVLIMPFKEISGAGGVGY